MGLIALIGDSILDNGAHTGTGPAVIKQMKAALPAGWQAVGGAKIVAAIMGAVGVTAQPPVARIATG